jgi:predicted  nucleic acid-binding Zn-ribbon protein
VSDEEWRVEIDLDDEQHGYGLGERLRSQDLDAAARKRLGRRVAVTRDGARLFLYAASEDQAQEAERVVRELLEADGLTAEITVTRWHRVEEAWKDASIPLPHTEEEVREELRRKEEAEAREAAEEGSYDWLVKVDVPSRSEAANLVERLRADGWPVHRLWRYVEVDALTREQADEFAERLRDELPADSEIWVEANPDDLPSPAFVLLQSRLRDPF